MLTTQMKSVGETMAIGRTFKESFQKALRGLEVGSFGFGCDGKDLWGTPQQPSLRRDPGQAGAAQRRARLVSPLCLQSRHVGRRNPRADAHRPLVPAKPGRDRRTGRRASRSRHAGRASSDATAAAGQAVRLFRPAIGDDLGHARNGRPRRPQAAAASSPRSSRSTPAPPSSRPTRPITIRPTKTKTKRRPSRPASGGS